MNWENIMLSTPLLKSVNIGGLKRFIEYSIIFNSITLLSHGMIFMIFMIDIEYIILVWLSMAFLLEYFGNVDERSTTQTNAMTVIYNEEYNEEYNEGFDINGYDKHGYDKNGYDKHGYDRNYRGKDGYSEHGYDINGFDKDGYNAYGYDKDGYNKYGYDKDNYDSNKNYIYTNYRNSNLNIGDMVKYRFHLLIYAFYLSQKHNSYLVVFTYL